jgi:predicted lactoylglutathione lyase
MSKQIYVNLPVSNLDRSKAFFASLGFGFNSQLTNDAAACMVVGDNIFVMLLVERFFKTFIQKDIDICDSTKSTEVLICLSAYRVIAARRWMSLLQRLKQPEAPSRAPPRTTDSCTAMRSKTSTAISGS